ncbi:MAG: hypothetical protein H7343_07085 [Undibacterium sp.]|nr:hypothetical protein [Opitutaceae bacterium]
MALAIGFDPGETLLTYADTPPSWATLHAPVLARVAAVCSAPPDAAAYARADAILARHNARLHPRAVEIAAGRIFMEILTTWAAPSVERRSPAALAAFSTFFQQRFTVYPESAAALTALRARGLQLGALIDVPYGRPRAFVETDLRLSGLAPLLDAVLTSVEVDERKPPPTGFHARAHALHTPAAALWYIRQRVKRYRWHPCRRRHGRSDRPRKSSLPLGPSAPPLRSARAVRACADVERCRRG